MFTGFDLSRLRVTLWFAIYFHAFRSIFHSDFKISKLIFRILFQYFYNGWKHFVAIINYYFLIYILCSVVVSHGMNCIDIKLAACLT